MMVACWVRALVVIQVRVISVSQRPSHFPNAVIFISGDASSLSHSVPEPPNPVIEALAVVQTPFPQERTHFFVFLSLTTDLS